MTRFSRLQTRLVITFLAVTLLPLSLTLWVSIELLNRSLDLNPIPEFDQMSKSFETLGREYYQRSRDQLRADIARGAVKSEMFPLLRRATWPSEISEFWDSGNPERFMLTGTAGDRLELLVRKGDGVGLYLRDLRPVRMQDLARQYTEARTMIERAQARDLRRGFVWTLVAVSGAVWVAGLGALIYWARRLGKPVHELTRALQSVASGDLTRRLDLDREDEVGAAVRAFNEMADQLQQSREKLIHVTRLATWQALARKTAHEVKNSLTPIRLTMEEIIARQDGADPFLGQAAQIVIDEVGSLERRVRAFSEFASEPPVQPAVVDINGVVEERIALLRSANPEVVYDIRLDAGAPRAMADPDLVKGVLTNLMENAAQAAGPGGVVLVRSSLRRGKVAVEVHDSGPGLSAQARATIFEPTISFKRGGMGLGLSIARKSAVLCGGDIQLIDGELGGAAFRIVLPEAAVLAAAGLIT
jgi:two-component system, NtrC family, nitrogen regulation sensor histidine kinase NtrY